MKIENEENKKNDSTEEERIKEEEKRKQRLFEIEKNSEGITMIRQ